MRAFFIYLKLILVKFCLDTSYAAAAGLLFRDNKLSEVARVSGMRRTFPSKRRRLYKLLQLRRTCRRINLSHLCCELLL